MPTELLTVSCNESANEIKRFVLLPCMSNDYVKSRRKKTLQNIEWLARPCSLPPEEINPMSTNPVSNLLDHGPLLEGEIFADEAVFLSVKNELAALPVANVRLLVDTGSNISGLDSRIIDKLGLKPYDSKAEVNGVGGLHLIQRFRCILFTNIFGQKGLPIDVVEGDFSHSAYHGVIGRDVLQFCKLVYNGPKNSFNIVAQDF